MIGEFALNLTRPHRQRTTEGDRTGGDVGRKTDPVVRAFIAVLRGESDFRMEAEA